MPLETSKEPFLFKTELSLVTLTGFKATDIRELCDGLKKVPDACIYYHTHNFLQQHQFLVQEPPNDFAYWATHILNESKIGERLASIDTVRFHSLENLRSELIAAIEPFLNEKDILRRIYPEQEFHFMKSVLFILPTSYTASTLREFIECLKNVSLYSLYYHLFDTRLRTPSHINDFSVFLGRLGEKAIAREVERLDPYSQTMEDVRRRIIRLLERRLKEEPYVTAK